MNMLQIFTVGDEIFGYCNGCFGGESYEDKVCVFITSKYAVFEDKKGYGEILNYFGGLEKIAPNWKDSKRSTK